jgi:hypothetical protein
MRTKPRGEAFNRLTEIMASLRILGSVCGNSSVGRARPCQGRGREFESRFPLHFIKAVAMISDSRCST